MNCEETTEHLASYALGALDDEEQVAVQEHLKGCPTCRLVLEQDLQMVRELPRSVKLVDPPANLKAKLMARVDSYEASIGRQVPAAGSGGGRRRWLPRIARALPAGAFVLAGLGIALLGWTVYQAVVVNDLRDENSQLVSNVEAIMEENEQLSSDVEQQWNALTFATSPEVEAVSLAATDLAPSTTASLFVDPKDNKALMMAAGLNPPSPDRVYQLWMRRSDGSIVSLGTFRTYRKGYVVWPFQSPYELAAHRSISVTMEPMGGSPWPTSPTVLGSADQAETAE